MKSDNAILGWVSLNVFLQGIKSAVNSVESYLASALTISQIAVAVATMILIIYKIRAARKSAKVSDDE